MGNYTSNGKIEISNDYICIRHRKYIIPDEIKRRQNKSQSINGEKISINGWKFKEPFFFKGMRKVKAEILHYE